MKLKNKMLYTATPIKNPPIAPRIAAPIWSIFCKIKPTKIPIMPATTKVRIINEVVWLAASSDFIESKMFDMENRRRVIPPPMKQPIAAIVQGKNFLPWNATMIPKTIASGPRI